MAQYFDNVDLKSEIKEYSTYINDTYLKFKTDNGVFSKDKLDFGTRSLLESIPIDDISGNVLDIGCGYGPIGIYLKKNCNCNVDMCDVNRRAIHLSSMNAKLNCVDVNIFESEGFKNINKKYNYIITNPPIRVGKEILYSIIMNAKNYLTDDGKMYLVIHKDQGAKSTVKDLSEIYNVDVINKNKGFFIISCEIR